jgi:hypothetical protein
MKSLSRAAICFAVVCSLGLMAFAGDKTSDKKQMAKEAKITMKQARAIAAKEVPGKIKEGELERENGQLIYSFDIAVKEGIKEVQVDAITGKVLKVETETAADEAKEKSAERKKNQPKKP